MAEDQNPDGAVVEDVVTLPKDVIPEKFRDDPTKVFESYSNLERSFHEQNQAKSQLEQERDQYRDAYEQALQAQPQQPDPSQLYEQFEADPITTMARIADARAQAQLKEWQAQQQQATAIQSEAQNQLIAGYVDNQLAAKYQDWGDVKGEVVTAIQNDPDLLPDTALTDPVRMAGALERVYKVVKADKLVSQAQELGVSAAELAQRQKLAAQTMSGAAGRPQAPPSDEVFAQNLLEAHQKGYSAYRDAN